MKTAVEWLEEKLKANPFRIENDKLWNEAKEMVQYGNSREIAHGRGIELAINRIGLKRTPDEITMENDPNLDGDA